MLQLQKILTKRLNENDDETLLSPRQFLSSLMFSKVEERGDARRGWKEPESPKPTLFVTETCPAEVRVCAAVSLFPDLISTVRSGRASLLALKSSGHQHQQPGDLLKP